MATALHLDRLKLYNVGLRESNTCYDSTVETAACRETLFLMGKHTSCSECFQEEQWHQNRDQEPVQSTHSHSTVNIQTCVHKLYNNTDFKRYVLKL